jgi:hypothetical protein
MDPPFSLRLRVSHRGLEGGSQGFERVASVRSQSNLGNEWVPATRRDPGPADEGARPEGGKPLEGRPRILSSASRRSLGLRGTEGIASCCEGGGRCDAVHGAPVGGKVAVHCVGKGRFPHSFRSVPPLAWYQHTSQSTCRTF